MTTTLPVPTYGDPVYDNAGKQVGTAAFNPNDGTPLPKPTVGSSSGTPSLLVTSGQSRANYANNVTTLQGAKNNLPTANPSVIDYLDRNKMPSDYNSRAQLAKENGIEGYTGAPDQNTKLLSILQNPKKDTAENKPTDTATKTDTTGAALQGLKLDDGGILVDASGVPVEDGTTQSLFAAANPDSGYTPTNTGGNYPSGSASTDPGKTGDPVRDALDPSLRNVWDTSLASLDKGIADAKANLESALATLRDNPAATAAVNMIMAKYDQQIQAMKDKNRMVLGGDVRNAARNGSLQFANEMETNFMSEEQDKAAQRVTNLITLETQMVLKAQQSYKEGDVKAFDTASKELERATKDKTDAINKLLTQTDKIVKTKQNEVKMAATAVKQQTSDDIRISTNLGKTMADTLKSSGIKDPKQIDAYIQEMADKYKIKNTDILKSSLIKAQQDQSKFDLSQKNTNSIIEKRNAPKVTNPKAPKATGGTDGGFKYSSDDVATYTQFLNTGGKTPAGMTYAGRGKDDQYVDPGAYIYALNDWITNGGTPQGFVKKFPVTNINPESYSLLPKAIQPKTKAGTTASTGFK